MLVNIVVIRGESPRFPEKVVTRNMHGIECIGLHIKYNIILLFQNNIIILQYIYENVIYIICVYVHYRYIYKLAFIT